MVRVVREIGNIQMKIIMISSRVDLSQNLEYRGKYLARRSEIFHKYHGNREIIFDFLEQRLTHLGPYPPFIPTVGPIFLGYHRILKST